MKTVELQKASKSLANYTTELNSGNLLITSDGEPVAALVSVRGMDRESIALSVSPEFAEIILHARSEIEKGDVFSLKAVKEELLEGSASASSHRRRSVSKRSSKTSKRTK
jgi:hypothetical protein